MAGPCRLSGHIPADGSTCAAAFSVDTRLFLVADRRVVRLRQEDLPELARAIVAVIRKRATAGVARVKNVDFIEIHGQGAHALVLRSDWEKLLPSIQNETFNTQASPVEPPGRYLDQKIAYSEPILDRADHLLYQRIVGVLRGFVTETFPTRSF